MSKKDFKNNIEDLFRDDDSNEQKHSSNQNINLDLNNISDEKLKWLVIKLMRYEKELKLWRTGRLNKQIFEETLKKYNLYYDPSSNEIKKLE